METLVGILLFLVIVLIICLATMYLKLTERIEQMEVPISHNQVAEILVEILEQMKESKRQK